MSDKRERLRELTEQVQKQTEQKFDNWLAALRRRRPHSSETQLKEEAAVLATMNRKETRKRFKHTSKDKALPKLMTVPKTRKVK